MLRFFSFPCCSPNNSANILLSIMLSVIKTLIMIIITISNIIFRFIIVFRTTIVSCIFLYIVLICCYFRFLFFNEDHYSYCFHLFLSIYLFFSFTCFPFFPHAKPLRLLSRFICLLVRLFVSFVF